VDLQTEALSEETERVLKSNINEIIVTNFKSFKSAIMDILNKDRLKKVVQFFVYMYE